MGGGRGRRGVEVGVARGGIEGIDIGREVRRGIGKDGDMMMIRIEVGRGERGDTEAEVEVLIGEGAGMTMSQEGNLIGGLAGMIVSKGEILIVDQGEVIEMSGNRDETLSGDHEGVDHLNIKIEAKGEGIIEW